MTISEATKRLMKELKKGLKAKYDAENKAIISGDNIIFPVMTKPVKPSEWTFWWIGIEGKGFQANFINHSIGKWGSIGNYFKYSELRNVERSVIMAFKNKYEISQNHWQGVTHGPSVLANSENCDDCKKIVDTWTPSSYKIAKRELEHLRDFKSKHGVLDGSFFI